MCQFCILWTPAMSNLPQNYQMYMYVSILHFVDPSNVKFATKLSNVYVCVNFAFCGPQQCQICHKTIKCICMCQFCILWTPAMSNLSQNYQMYMCVSIWHF